MAIFVTGDTHSDIDFRKLSNSNWSIQKNLTREDYLIICGDFGAIWYGNKKDNYLLNKFYGCKKCTVLFVDGNHENFDALNEYEIQEWHGGKVHKIRDNVFHLMRGQVFDIDGLKFFTMGGASSHDKEYRKEGVSWWAAELPCESEFEEAYNNLDKVNWNVDYVISHCSSCSVMDALNCDYERDELNKWFEEMDKKLIYQKWYFGHYHKDQKIDDKHECLYQSIIQLGVIKK